MSEQIPRKAFADYKEENYRWITLMTGEFYPDILPNALLLYTPIITTFGELLKIADSSTHLFLLINEVAKPQIRIQLARIFRRYIAPLLSVEMLKRKSNTQRICDQFGDTFRPLAEVQAAFALRPVPDEALCALLWEYKDRGKKGYDLTELFFELFATYFPELKIRGPKRAGQDIRLGTIFENYSNPNRPVDFVIYDTNGKDVLAIGLARYDGDRGGSQEDDRPGLYFNCASEILQFAAANNLNLKVLFINDGPGLLLGSMWADYASIESNWQHQVMVATLRMIPERLTYQWLKS